MRPSSLSGDFRLSRMIWHGVTSIRIFSTRSTMKRSVSIHVDAYVCGNGETIRASPDEVAEISVRIEAEPDFLSDQCDCVGEADFEIQWSPDESYFNEGFEM